MSYTSTCSKVPRFKQCWPPSRILSTKPSDNPLNNLKCVGRLLRRGAQESLVIPHAFITPQVSAVRDTKCNAAYPWAQPFCAQAGLYYVGNPIGCLALLEGGAAAMARAEMCGAVAQCKELHKSPWTLPTQISPLAHVEAQPNTSSARIQPSSAEIAITTHTPLSTKVSNTRIRSAFLSCFREVPRSCSPANFWRSGRAKMCRSRPCRTPGERRYFLDPSEKWMLAQFFA